MNSSSITLREYRILYPYTAAYPTLSQNGKLAGILAQMDAKARRRVSSAPTRRESTESQSAIHKSSVRNSVEVKRNSGKNAVKITAQMATRAEKSDLAIRYTHQSDHSHRGNIAKRMGMTMSARSPNRRKIGAHSI